jgi:hypothetical protein
MLLYQLMQLYLDFLSSSALINQPQTFPYDRQEINEMRLCFVSFSLSADEIVVEILLL